MNERLHPETHAFLKSSIDPSNTTYHGEGPEVDEDAITEKVFSPKSEDWSTDKNSFSEKDETVYIEPRVDGDEWILAQEAFFEHFPSTSIEAPTEHALADKLADGRMTVDAFRKNFANAEVQYETLAALLRGMPHVAGGALDLPNIDEYLSWSQDEKNTHQTSLELGLAKSQYAIWLKQISGRFSVLAEFLQAYKNVADAEGISLESDDDVDSAEKAA